MPKVVDLNKLITDKERKKASVCGNIGIWFESNAILNALVKRILKSDTCFVMGCAAWLTNTRIIGALSTLKGVSVICTRDKVVKAMKPKYRLLPKHDDIPTVLVLGTAGRKASLMHHKFLVGMDKDQKPIWVSTGSFNLTQSATTNLENLMIIESPEVAEVYLKEFQRLYPLARTLRLYK